jgi:chaperonin GroES
MFSKRNEINTMKFTPLHDRVLIKRLDKESKTKSGIIIPDTAKEKPAEGIVIAVGSGQLNDSGTSISMTVKKDDKVLFAKWGGTEVKIDDEEFLVMKESDILGIIV